MKYNQAYSIIKKNRKIVTNLLINRLTPIQDLSDNCKNFRNSYKDKCVQGIDQLNSFKDSI